MAKLVALGDSLTQGFRSLAITDSGLSPPALIAEAMGIPAEQFDLPDFRGEGGLPFNVEWLARELEKKFGGALSGFEWPAALADAVALADRVEDFWERGEGAATQADTLYHNLAIWGFEVGDAYNVTAEICRNRIGTARDNFLGLPSEPRLRTALRVLNPALVSSRDQDTQLAVAKKIRERDGRIDHLIVAYGANNCLGTVVELEIRETGEDPPGPFSGCTLWTRLAFEKEYAQLVLAVEAIDAEHVYVATVPHVTIPPISRGIMKDRGRLPENRKYFDYYARFLVPDQDFDPDRHKHLTGAQAETIDRRIDEYNAFIRKSAEQNGWSVVDLEKLLGDLAWRRNHGKPKRALPPPLTGLNVKFFEIGPTGAIRRGGLISLDGVHPTVAGYAVMAQEFIDVMRANEPSIRDIDFAAVRARDTLVSNPPLTLDDVYGALRTLEGKFNLTRILDKVSGAAGLG